MGVNPINSVPCLPRGPQLEVREMVVAIVAFTFLLFVAIDALLERRQRAQLTGETQERHGILKQEAPHWVAGYSLPQALHYHQGHTWLHWVSPEEAYVGVDDFARRLLGKDSQFELPSVGAYVSQGKEAAKAKRDGDRVSILSPGSGEVVAVNHNLQKDTEGMGDDVYGAGWLYKIRSSDLFLQLSNLLNGTVADRWMEDSRDRFQHRLMLATGNVMQDGGVFVDDIAEHLSHEDWKELADEFLALQQDQI